MTVSGTALKPIEILPKEIMRVLFVEHDQVYRKQITKDLEQMGCRVDGVNNPHEAIQKLSTQKYELVIVDIGFPYPSISGDQFVVDHYPLMEGAQIVALTGQDYNIRFTEELKGMGAVIIKKAEEEVPLKAVSKRVYEKAKQDVLDRIAEVRSTNYAEASPYPFAEGFMRQLEEELLRNLNEIPDKDKKTIRYKGELYSVAGLIDEVNQRTAIGGDLIRMMLTLVKWRHQNAKASDLPRVDLESC